MHIYILCNNYVELLSHLDFSFMTYWRTEAHTWMMSVTLLFFVSLQYKTSRSHVAMHLFSNQSQMASECGKSKKLTKEPLGKVKGSECATDVLATF